MDPIKRAREVATQFADESDTDVVVFSGGVWTPCEDRFRLAFLGKRRRKNLLLVLTTHGGSPDIAYAIARAFQRLYSHVTLLVDTVCKSSGTLIAVGANELVMSDRAQLGPLDTQLLNRDEVGELSSGLTAGQALRNLRLESFNLFNETFWNLRRSVYSFSTKLAAQVASDMVVGLFRPIYEQLDPMRLAENQRAILLSHEYGIRLDRGNLRERALARLISGYPSHGFVIDRKECEQLFHHVGAFDNRHQVLVDTLEPFALMGLDNDRNGRDAVIAIMSEEPAAECTDNNGEGEENARVPGADQTGTAATGPDRGAAPSSSQPAGFIGKSPN